MNCPTCGRGYSRDSVFPIKCSCRTRFDKDGNITSARKGRKPLQLPTRLTVDQAPEPVGTNLASLIPEWAKSMKGGCKCRDWEAKMNRWRVDGCETHREQIIDHLMNQSEHLVKPLQHLPAALKRAVAGKMLDKAIKMSRQK